MPSEGEYRNAIQQLGREQLLSLWRQIEAGSTPGWDPGRAFEHLVLRLFQIEGAEVRWPYTVRLADVTVEQLDGAVYVRDMAFLLETKDQADPVNVEAIAKLRNQLARRPPSTVGLLFSRSGYTQAARTLAQFLAPQTILLWDGKEIRNALVGVKSLHDRLVRKYRVMIEEGVPDYQIEEDIYRGADNLEAP